MKAPLHRITTRVYAEPWLMARHRYESICTQLKAAAGDRLSLSPEHVRTFSTSPTRTQKRDVLEDVEIDSGIAILPIHGILGKHLDPMETLCGGCDIATIQEQALALIHRTDIHTVILHINSPGGAAAGVADTATVLRDLATHHRLIAYCDDACSGAYWLACTADEIYCGQSATVGSISAVCALQDLTRMYEDMGISVEVFTDGTLKGAGIPGTSLSPQQRADIQQRVEHIGSMFKTFIRTRRSLPDDLMQGQWFYGDAAEQHGLVDGLAPTLQHVIAAALSTT